METVIETLDSGDFCSLSFVVVLSVAVAAAAVGTQKRLNAIARKYAGLGFVMYVVGRLWRDGLHNVDDLIFTTLSGFCAATLTYAAAGVVLRTGLVASELLLSPMEFLRNIGRRKSLRIAAAEREKRREIDRRNREAVWTAREQEKAKLARQQATVRRQRQAGAAADASKRAAFRFACELCYSQHRPAIDEKLPPEEFQRLLAMHLSDDFGVATVEANAEKLRTLIEGAGASDSAQASSPFESIGDIAAHFAAKRSEIAELPYDEEIRETLLLEVDEAEQKTLALFLRS